MIHVNSLPLWLGTIDENRVDPSVKDKLVQYQIEAAEVLADYFFGRRAKKVEKYVAKGKPVEWAEVRVDGIDDRNEFTKTLAEAGVSGYGFAQCTDAEYKVVTGSRAKDLRTREVCPRGAIPARR